jgi:hypothetical protein
MAEGLHFRLPGGFLEVLVNITTAVSRKEKKMWRRSPKVLRHAVMAFFFRRSRERLSVPDYRTSFWSLSSRSPGIWAP